MSTTHHFVLWAPYSKAPGTKERMSAARSAHLAHLDPLVASGAIKLGGPVMSPHADLSVPQEEQEGYCSLLIFRGESLDSVRKMVEADPFYIEGVWDLEKLALHPFHQVV